MEKLTGEKKNNLKNCIFKSLLLYTGVSFGYIAALALNTKSVTTLNSGFAALLLRNLAILFAFSLIFGFSFLIFKAKNLPSSAKWTFHVFILLAATIITTLQLTNIYSRPDKIVLSIFLSTLFFSIIYSFSALFVTLYKRKRR